jgi:hypothetical protein
MCCLQLVVASVHANPFDGTPRPPEAGFHRIRDRPTGAPDLAAPFGTIAIPAEIALNLPVRSSSDAR